MVLFAAGPVNVSGLLAAGRIKGSDIIPTVCQGHGAVALTINNVASLLAAIRADEVYLNVHSQANPAGEVRAMAYTGDTSTESEISRRPRKRRQGGSR